MKKLIPLLVLIVITTGLYFSGRLDFSKPEIKVSDVSSIGKNSKIKLHVEDNGSGLKSLRVSLVQDGREIVLYNSDEIKQKRVNIDINLNPQKAGLLEKEAILKIQAKNNALINKTASYEKQVKIDLTPPVISMLEWTRNLINGGTGFVFFKVSEPLKDSFVSIGNYQYRCLSHSYGYICPFSFPYFEDNYLPLYITLKDIADNTISQNLPYNLKKVNYAKSVLNIDDNFIQTKVKPLSDKDIQDNVELFRYVNTQVRKKNEETIHKIASECKNKEPLFEGYFSYLENSAKLGGFADYRKYRYNGEIIEGADAYHKGFDFASVKNAPVKAANNGVVVFTGFLGIYGNSVIIDHGLCVYSLYSHLDSINVKEGQKVDKNTVIGRTGTTGLAVGDHLHFGLLVNGIEVNPIEWFDPKWLETRFYTPYKVLKESK